MVSFITQTRRHINHENGPLNSIDFLFKSLVLLPGSIQREFKSKNIIAKVSNITEQLHQTAAQHTFCV